ncbi:MAG: type II secretion system protein [bacterium]|nr:type II secretion system protein [bacterium]
MNTAVTTKKRKSRGFTLLETMVAISILLTALGGPFVVTQVGLRTARKASQELVASNLAQEGIEYIRYIRDTNPFMNKSWLTLLQGSPNDCVADLESDNAKTCVVDAIQNNIYDSPDSQFACVLAGDVFSCPFIRFNADSGFYGYEDNDDETIYHRAVHMKISRMHNGDPVEVQVVSEVGWEDQGDKRTIRIEEYITDWR